jgi:hypothetical protein
MEAQLTEPGTFPAQLYANSFFAKYPTDARFLQCTYHKFVTSSSLDSDTIEFNLEKFDAANLYLIQDTVCEVNFNILNADGSLPNQSTKVAPVNNMLHSLFEGITVTINDMPITASKIGYPYKAYISNCLSYNNAIKATHLATQGWYSDTGSFLGDDTNSGFESRCIQFHENYDLEKPYRRTGVTLFGRLLHDLVSCETGLPPQTKVKIELDRSKDEFFIMCDKTDPEKYKVRINHIILYVPVAQLSMNVYNEFSALYSKEPIAIHYRRIQILYCPVSKDKEEYWSESLFSDSDLPCRIIVGFVVTNNKNGNYHSNPFDFRRNWKVPSKLVVSESQTSIIHRHQLLEQSLEEKFNIRFDALNQTLNEKIDLVHI